MAQGVKWVGPLECGHPKRKNFSHGMCQSCYMAIFRAGPEYKKRRARQAKQYRASVRGDAAFARLSDKKYEQEPGTYERMFKEQNGRCLICGKRPVTKRLALDHDHTIQREYGIIIARGLLCSSCNNRFVGSVEWDDDVIRRGIEYLNRILALRAELKEKNK